jgi:hypothetical protein
VRYELGFYFPEDGILQKFVFFHVLTFSDPNEYSELAARKADDNVSITGFTAYEH